MKPKKVDKAPMSKAVEPKPIKDKKSLTPFEWAKAEIGVLEVLGKEHNPRILFYHDFTTLDATTDEIPWCASFMCASLENTGYKSTKSARARSYTDYGEEGTGAIGDIAVLKRGKNPEQGHTAFVAKKYTVGDKYIYLLGGNQSNSVCVAKYRAKDLITFRKPVLKNS